MKKRIVPSEFQKVQCKIQVSNRPKNTLREIYLVFTFDNKFHIYLEYKQYTRKSLHCAQEANYDIECNIRSMTKRIKPQWISSHMYWTHYKGYKFLIGNDCTHDNLETFTLCGWMTNVFCENNKLHICHNLVVFLKC
jgi:hypothetical protein